VVAEERNRDDDSGSIDDSVTDGGPKINKYNKKICLLYVYIRIIIIIIIIKKKRRKTSLARAKDYTNLLSSRIYLSHSNCQPDRVASRQSPSIGPARFVLLETSPRNPRQNVIRDVVRRRSFWAFARRTRRDETRRCVGRRRVLVGGSLHLWPGSINLPFLGYAYMYIYLISHARQLSSVTIFHLRYYCVRVCTVYIYIYI